jgi:hypothetical protein
VELDGARSAIAAASPDAHGRNIWRSTERSAR